MIRVTFMSFCCKITKNFEIFKTFVKKNADLHIFLKCSTFAGDLRHYRV